MSTALWWFVELVLVGLVTTEAVCPRGFFVDGVRPTGSTYCVETPPGLENEVPVGWVARRWPVRVRCQPHQRAVVVHARKVSCR